MVNPRKDIGADQQVISDGLVCFERNLMYRIRQRDDVCVKGNALFRFLSVWNLHVEPSLVDLEVQLTFYSKDSG